MYSTNYSEQRAVSSEQSVERWRTRHIHRTVFYCLLLTAYCLLAAGCRQDMQDQPRYEAYEASDGKFFDDQQSARPLIEGTVARGHLRDNERSEVRPRRHTRVSQVSWSP